MCVYVFILYKPDKYIFVYLPFYLDSNLEKPLTSMVDIQYLYDKMDRNNILLSYKGDVTSELLTSILDIVESKMDNMQESPQLRKKVYIVLVELLQNLYHHMDDPSLEPTEKMADKAIFLIGKEDNLYKVITGNYIKNDTVPLLKKKMDEINALSPEQVKEQYKRILSNGQMSDKGGGGLGMIDIARRTGKPLLYDFVPINDNFSFFTLNVVIE